MLMSIHIREGCVLEEDTKAEPPGGLGGQQAGGMLKRLQTLGACNDP